MIDKLELQNLELGFYYCLIETSSVVNEKEQLLEIKQRIEIRELCYSQTSEIKYFPPAYGNEKILAFEKINQKPTFEDKEITYWNGKRALETIKAWKELKYKH